MHNKIIAASRDAGGCADNLSDNLCVAQNDIFHPGVKLADRLHYVGNEFVDFELYSIDLRLKAFISISVWCLLQNKSCSKLRNAYADWRLQKSAKFLLS